MDTIKPVNNWALGFGFSIYCFEGIGVILPIQDITADEKYYPKIVIMVIGFVGALHIMFGLYCSAVWGDTIQLIITNQFDGGLN